MYDKEKLKDESFKEEYNAIGLDIEMGAINDKMGVNLGIEDYVMMAKAGINKVQDFMTIIDTLKEGINKIENAKAIWDKFMDMFEDI